MLDVHFAKHDKSPVILNPDTLELKYSKYEILKHTLRRINNRFTPSELQFMTKHLGHSPALLDNDQVGGKYATSQIIKRYLKAWKEDKDNTPPILNIEEYEDLLRMCDKNIDNAKKEMQGGMDHRRKTYELDSNIQSVSEANPQVNLAESNSLPLLPGGLMSKQGEVKSYPLMVDSGSQGCVLPLSFAKECGYTDNDFDKSVQFNIRTANGVTAAVGTLKIPVFARSAGSGSSREFFRFDVEFIVIDAPLKKCILGINFLRQCEMTWKSDGSGDTLVLSCRSRDNLPVRRKFRICDSHFLQQIRLKNTSRVYLQALEPTKIEFYTTETINPEDCRVYHLPDCMFISKEEHLYLDPLTTRTEIKMNKGWPTEMKTYCSYSVVATKKKSFGPNSIELKAVNYDRSSLDNIFDSFHMDLNSFNTDFNSNVGCNIEQMDNSVIDRISMLPPYLEDMSADGHYMSDGHSRESKLSHDGILRDHENEYWLPNIDHLPNDVQAWYKKLFSENKQVMSRGKTDVGTATTEPIKFPIPPTPTFDKVRQFGPLEQELVDDNIQMLLDSDIIEPDNGESPFNANILLVSTGSETSKKFSSTIADRLPREQQLAELKKAARVVVDFRSLNYELENKFQTVVLPKVDQILPRFHNKMVSKIDIRAGFHNFLIDESCRHVFAFRVGDRSFRYKRMPMGVHWAPARFQRMMTKIINKESFESFKARHPELKGTSFLNSFVAYLDDYCIISPRSHRIHFLLWQYVVEQFAKFGLKLNVHKCQILEQKQMDYLGIGIDFQNNQYFLPKDRAQAFANWDFPRNKKALQSRIATLNYFSGLLPSLKQLTACLMLMCHDNVVYEPLPLHIMEFQSMQFLIQMNLRFTIPNALYPLLLTTDSSHLSYASCLFQWIPKADVPFCDHCNGGDKVTQLRDHVNTRNRSMQHPGHADQDMRMPGSDGRLKCRNCLDGICFCPGKLPCGTFPCQTRVKERMSNNLPCYDKTVEIEYELVLCGAMSKSFPKASLMAPIPIKEIHSVLAGLEHFQSYIRNNLSVTILLSDVLFIQWLARIKSCSTKMYSISIFLSTFSSLHLFYTVGAFGNALADALTRQGVGEIIQSDYGLSREKLEPKRVMDSKNVVISPETLHNLMMSPVPSGYTDTPYRRVAKYSSLPSISEIRKRLEQPTPESQLMKLIWNDYSSLTSDDYAFCQPGKEGKLMSKTEVESLQKKLKVPEIRLLLNNIEQHSYHVSSFEGLEKMTREFSSRLYKFMKEFNMADTEPTLYHLARDYTSNSENDLDSFLHLLDIFYHSSLCNDTVRYPLEYVSFISLSIYSDTEIILTTLNDDLWVTFGNQITLPPGEPRRIKINISFSSRHVLDFMTVFPPHILSHNSVSYQGMKTIFTDLYLMNTADTPVMFSKFSLILKIVPRGGGDCCEKKVCFVLSRVDNTIDNADYHLVNLYNLIISPTLKSSCQDDFFKMEETIENHATSLSGRPAQPGEIGPDQGRLINRLILLSNLISSNSINPKLISQLQRKDPALRHLIALAETKKLSDFKFVNGMLVKVVASPGQGKRMLLVIDQNTLQLILEALHLRNSHFGNKVMLQHIRSNFFHPSDKLIVARVAASCLSCQHNLSTNRVKYINLPSEIDRYAINTVLSCDTVDNLPYCVGNKYKYLFICVEHVTTKLYAKAAENLTAETLINCTEEAFSFFNVPRVIRTDFQASFASSAYHQFLHNYGVIHEHSHPRRSEAMGSVERSNALFRSLLSKIIQDEGGEARLSWHRWLPRAIILYNNQIPYSDYNNLTRYSLFQSPLVYQNPSLISSAEFNPTSCARAQIDALNRIDQTRKYFRKFYKPLRKDDKFRIHQLVSVVKSKDELLSSGGGTGLLPTAASVFRIIECKEDSPTVRLLNLSNQDQITVHKTHIRPLDSTRVFSSMKLLPMRASSFFKNVFRKGSGRSLLEDITEDCYRHRVTPEDYVIRAKDDIVLPDGAAVPLGDDGPPVVQDDGPVSVHDQAPPGPLVPPAAQVPHGPPHQPRSNTRYNLRSRIKARERLNLNINVDERKIRFSDQVLQRTYNRYEEDYIFHDTFTPLIVTKPEHLCDILFAKICIAGHTLKESVLLQRQNFKINGIKAFFGGFSKMTN